MNVTLRQLSYFRALARERHFGRAAAISGISQPALSVQIRELEAALGGHLVERHTREVVITPKGLEVLSRAERILGEVDDLEHAARWREGLAGRLNIGVIPTIAPYLLPVALPLLRSGNIALDLRVREAQTDVVLADLDAGRLDVAVVALPSGRSNLIELPLFEDRFLLAGNAASLAAARAGSPPRPSDLDPLRLLLLDEGHCLADQALEVCALDRSALRVDLGASSLTTLSGLVAGGFGLTLLPEIALRQECAGAPDLDLMRFAGPEPSRTVGLVRRPLTRDDGWFGDLGRVLTQASRVLTDWAADSFPPAA